MTIRDRIESNIRRKADLRRTLRDHGFHRLCEVMERSESDRQGWEDFAHYGEALSLVDVCLKNDIVTFGIANRIVDAAMLPSRAMLSADHPAVALFGHLARFWESPSIDAMDTFHASMAGYVRAFCERVNEAPEWLNILEQTITKQEVTISNRFVDHYAKIASELERCDQAIMPGTNLRGAVIEYLSSCTVVWCHVELGRISHQRAANTEGFSAALHALCAWRCLFGARDSICGAARARYALCELLDGDAYDIIDSDIAPSIESGFLTDVGAFALKLRDLPLDEMSKRQGVSVPVCAHMRGIARWPEVESWIRRLAAVSPGL